ncbi:proline--tRNA ligase, partial [Patescibacteria group bacterium]|nr:proline--tRNA ligase [Patescibacteria group bacterium]
AKDSADAIYKKLSDEGIEVLYDDRDARAGEKFADSDLLGIPHRIVVSDKTIEAGTVEYKNRKSSETKMISEDEILNLE